MAEYGAYGYIDEGIQGLYDQLDVDIQGRWVAGEEIEFGEAVFTNTGEDNIVYAYKNDVGVIAFDADFVSGNVITITVNGVATSPVTFATDHDTTAAAVASAINALDGVSCVLDPADTDNRTFLIQVKGQNAEVSEEVTGGASQATGTITYDSSQVFVGISTFFQNSVGVYQEFDPINVLSRGLIWVRPTAVTNANKRVFVVTTAGTTLGSFGTAGYEINATYRRNADANALGQIEVFGIRPATRTTYADTFI